MLAGKRVLLGVRGSIAAYQAADMIGMLRSQLADVWVIMTRAATRFITPLTLETISRHRVTVDMFTNADNTQFEHISLARFADMILIAPATANFLGKAASGIADDMLTTTLMAVKGPRIVCPAMNANMWHDSIVQENVRKLHRHGYRFVDPEYGEMACGGEGWGRLARLDRIVTEVMAACRELDAASSRAESKDAPSENSAPKPDGGPPRDGASPKRVPPGLLPGTIVVRTREMRRNRHGRAFEAVQGAQQRRKARVHERGDTFHG